VLIIIKAQHFNANLTLFFSFTVSTFTSGCPIEPEAFVAGALLFEVVGEQVYIHLHLEQRDARPVGLSMSSQLRGRTGKRPKTMILVRHEGLRLLYRQGDLPLLKRRMLRSE